MPNKLANFLAGRGRFVLVGILVIILVAGAFLLIRKFSQSPLVPGTPGGTNLPPTTEPGEEVEPYDIHVKLSDGGPQVEPIEILPMATGEPLSPEEIQSILLRLPAMPPGQGEQVEFNRPAESLPPPRPGQTITEKFPAVQSGPGPQSVETGALQVLRYAPQGEIPIAPFISVTFNQPMVPVGTLGDLAASEVPVQIQPELPGTWRWLGTRTLSFEYDSELIDRLPKATEYHITVPAGTISATGGKLAESVTWTFTTPPPLFASTWPGDAPQPLDPVLFMLFDQRIDPAAMLEHTTVTAGNRAVSIRMATQEEIEGDQAIKDLVEGAPEGRWMAFRAEQPFPAETSITVTVEAGAPSAEGPLTTQTAQSFTFSTYAPLRVVEHGCSWYGGDCPPLTPFYIRFNNPLDQDLFREDMLRVEPEIPGLSIDLYGDTISISGETRGQTTYTVTVSKNLQDEFGQQLGKEARLTFKVGKAEPVLSNPGGSFITLDPTTSQKIFSVFAMNYRELNLKVYAVQPADWPAFMEAVRNWRQSDVAPRLPGITVEDSALKLDMPDDTLSQVDIDLGKYMDGSSGHFILFIEPPAGLFESDNERYRRLSQTIITWVQVTQIGLDAYTDHTDMLVWATDLKDGSPLSGVRIQPGNDSPSMLTGPDGVARAPIPSGATYLVASLGGDRAILPASGGLYGQPWAADYPNDFLRWYVFNDRNMYRPGEEVHIKGWLRLIGARQDGDVMLVGGKVSTVNYQVMDPQGNSLLSGDAEVNALGGFDLAFTIPLQSNLGPAQVIFNARGNLAGVSSIDYYHSLQVQEFRRPEFEVTARNESTGPYFAGGHATLAVDAKYYAGGGLPNAEVTWQVTASSGNYTPPNWPDFIFGSWRPWWFYDYGYPGTGDSQIETFSGRTDVSGTHYLALDFEQQGDISRDPQPRSIIAQATVMDVNRQAWSSTTTLLVHPADLYVGLRSERYFVPRGTPLKIDFIVVDLDGEAVPGRAVEITAGRTDWKYRDGEWQEELVDVQSCRMSSAAEPQTCTFETPIGGTYQITAIVTDELGRKNQSRMTRWVSGGQQPPSRKVEQEKVTLIPDKESYQPGDTAQILVQSPFSPAEGLLTVSRDGTLYTTRFSLQDGSATLEIPIEEEYIPNLFIQVDLAGSAPRLDDLGEPLAGVPPRPAYATGQLKLSIPPLVRTLSLTAVPEETELEPGGETSLIVTVKDADGLPVYDAELAVVVVDEAILALSSYDLPDPLGIFYQDRAAYLLSVYGRSSIILADPQALARQATQDAFARGIGGEAPAEGMPMPAATQTPAMEAGGYGDEAQTQPSIEVRSNFNPLAVFAPSVRTDLRGEARIDIKLPDNLTRYRVMVVAVDTAGNKFGSGESSITARLPLMVRPSAPRFLNFGDRFELPVVLQNQTDLPITVSVAARSTNLELEQAGLRVTVPANDRLEVRFPASTIMAGTARLQVAAVSGDFADAATVELPVYTPATSEAFATYGVVDEGAIAQPVLYPSGVFPQYGGLEISTSSTALQALTDAVLYLVSYPFECSEQLASRILAVASLRDVLSAFQAEGLPEPGEMERAIERDIQRLQGMQNYDGGFPYWRRGFESVPFNTIHVTHALLRAQQKGFTVPSDMQQNALGYLREIENYYPSWYSEQTRWTLSSYALYVRNLAGDRDSAKASRLLSEAGLESLSMEAIGWLWSVIDDPSQLEAIRLYINNHVVETAGAANFTTAYSDQTYLLLSSDRRTDAILLDALIEDNPQSDLIPKLVAGLLAHRTQGRWGNTQENVFVLLALDRYFNTYEAQTPDFVARIWLGNTYAGESGFHGRTTDIHETLVPMDYVLSETAAGGGMQDLVLSKEGPGRLYYRIGLQYAPDDLVLDPLEMGFVVQRKYEAIDDPSDVTQDADGTWHIKAGARVRVRITLVADNRRYHVALVDPLPAGLEIVNPALAVSETIPQDPTTNEYRNWWWWGTWYEHQNMRDDRAEAFTSLLWDGVYEYTYNARATTPGVFIVPPAKAEEMYSPEVFGRSGSDRVIVE